MNKKIWIIDDYLPMLDSMRSALELNHYEVEIAQNDLNILNNNNKPDLILIDYDIPGLDINHFFEKVKNYSELRPIPTILMSGHILIEDLASRCGADDFIAKPFNVNQLLGKIEKLCLTNH